jgi:hypothetical protein
MGKKGITCGLILLFALAFFSPTLLLTKSVYAQSTPIPTLSAPTFTARLGGDPVRVNTTYSLDASTGQIVANLGYTNQFSLVDLTVKNQPFDSSYGSLYYNVRVKNHNSTSWQVVGWGDEATNPEQSTNSDQTELSLGTEGSWGQPSLAGMQTDIQVQAMLGGFSFENNGFTEGYVFSGTTGAWSNTETIDVPANTQLSPTLPPSSSTQTSLPLSTATSISTTGTTSPSNSVPITTFAIVVAVLAGIISVLLTLVLTSKRKNDRQASLVV